MSEIRCPKCGTVFQIDESDYGKIVSQVRDEEFSKEMAYRVQHYEKEKADAISLAKAEEERKHAEALSKTKEELTSEINSKDREIAELKAAIEKFELEKDMAVRSAVDAREGDIQAKDAEIAMLKAAQEQWDTEKKLALSEAEKKKIEEINSKDREIDGLRAEIKQEKDSKIIEQENMKKLYESQLKAKDEEVEFYKDFKARQSTKMVGESLEKFCENEFNKIRPAGFQNAYFEKDNDVSDSRSKGDYIFRESEDGVEFVSIMFEMKNEADQGTSKKHSNEDFFKELDKDRNEKGCEYAVLVTMLEPDNEYYNTGIVDVSHRYPKMYVIRPQFFIPLITLIRNAARNSLQYKQELVEVRNQNLDITHFEENINTFKHGFERNYNLASKKFDDAIEEIDKTIKLLEKVRDNLKGSENNLRLANEKAQDLTIKKLTKGNPTMTKMFDDLKKDSE